jgi:mannose-1-phosphate guanylyltransferase/mannose-6-phosphate isomerase
MARDPETILLVMPADHSVAGDEDFRQSVDEAVALAGQDWLTVLGVKPHEPSSAFGYIMRGEGARVARFIEKPQRENAMALIAEGALWNAGMVAAKARIVIEALTRHEPALVAAVQAAIDAADHREDRLALAASEFAAATKISFDHAVLERHDHVAVTPLRAIWRDLGTWSEVAALYAADGDGNRHKGDARFTASSGNFIFAPERTVLALGVDDLVIVDSSDALLVAKRDHLALLGDVVKQLPDDAIAAAGETKRFAWGTCETISADAHCLVRKMSIVRGQATKAADHGRDAGHWIVVSGVGTAVIGGRTLALRQGQSAATPIDVARHVHNTGEEDLVLMDVRLAVSTRDRAPVRKAV